MSSNSFIFPAAFSGTVWHCQFVNCGITILSQGGGADLHNTLFSSCGTAVEKWFADDDAIYTEHVTADGIGTFYDAGAGNSGYFTNSILTAVTNIGLTPTLVNSTTKASSSGFYQTVWAGKLLSRGWEHKPECGDDKHANGFAGVFVEQAAELLPPQTFSIFSRLETNAWAF